MTIVLIPFRYPYIFNTLKYMFQESLHSWVIVRKNGSTINPPFVKIVFFSKLKKCLLTLTFYYLRSSADSHTLRFFFRASLSHCANVLFFFVLYNYVELLTIFPGFTPLFSLSLLILSDKRKLDLISLITFVLFFCFGTLKYKSWARYMIFLLLQTTPYPVLILWSWIIDAITKKTM